MKKNLLLHLSALVAVLAAWTPRVMAQLPATTVFYCNRAMQTYVVPAGVTQVAFDAVGARGGLNYNYSRPGNGGRVTGILTVTPGQVLNIFVGGKGSGTSSPNLYGYYAYPGGFNGGGNGYGYGGGGGGATDIRIGGTAASDRKVVAGGGGGAGGYNCCTYGSDRGGDGGGLAAENGYYSWSSTSSGCGKGGVTSGTTSTGGAAATSCGSPTAGNSAGTGLGGNAGTCVSNSGPGGGGGGYAGGGGGSQGGGGGGSNYADATITSNVAHAQGVNNDGDGYCAITPVTPGSAMLGFTGSSQTFSVPSTAGYVYVDVQGGVGGSSISWPFGNYPSQGGFGGRTQAVVAVNPGSSLTVNVGGMGTMPNYNGSTGVFTAGVGGYNGGAAAGYGNSSYAGGGGGGGTDVRVSPGGVNDRVVVAGGGGGASTYPGGGSSYYPNYAKGGDGGGLTGAAGFAYSNPLYGGGGGGGTQSAGGAAVSSGNAGALLSGGAGNTSCCSYYSGGGGGGYYGGGSAYSNYGGAGGGSSYTVANGTVSGITHTQGYNKIGGSGSALITVLYPTVSTSLSTIGFGGVVPAATSTPMSFIMTGSYLLSAPLNFAISSSAASAFEYSFDGSTWYNNTQTYDFTAPGFNSVPVYVRFTPAAAIAYTGNITISGGGLVTPVTVALTGTGTAACTGTPSPGTISSTVSSISNSNTPIPLTLSGASAAGGVTYQWQVSNNNSTWTSMNGEVGTSCTYTSPMYATTYFRCVSTCPSFATANSNTVTVTFALASSGCIPTAANTNTSFAAGNGSGSPVIIAGASGTLTDNSTHGSGNGGSPTYYNNTATHSVTMCPGATYSSTMSTTNCYVTGTIWIDFNDNGSFDNNFEMVGGFTFNSQIAAQCPGMRPNPAIKIPAGAPLGTHRMRVQCSYNGNYVSNAYLAYTAYPNMTPCPTTAQQYADTRDYTVFIVNPVSTPVLTVSSSSLPFGNVLVNTTSAPVRHVAVDGQNLIPANGIINISAPSGFKVSIDGINWSSSAKLPYANGTITDRNVYVQYTPAGTSSNSGNVNLNGGGATSVVSVNGTGVATMCSGTPTAGTAACTPSTGGSNTVFTLSIPGGSVAGLFYQWQSSPNGTSGWENIPQGIYATYSFKGIMANMYYRCLVSCGTEAPVVSATVPVTYAPSLVASSCTPSSVNSNSSYYVGTSGNPVIINGDAGTIISDASVYNSGPGGAPRYYNNTNLAVNMSRGNTYTTTVGPTSSYMTASIWIDFDDNGSFDNGTELVGGYAYLGVTNPSPSGRPTPFITIPSTAQFGAHRMRVMAVYEGNNPPGASTAYPCYPLMDPCPSSSVVQYADTRDYTVVITSGCSQVPSNNGGIVSGTPAAACAAFSSALFNVGVSQNAGITYNWQSSSSPYSGFSNIPGATSSSVIVATSGVGTTYYRNVATCAANGQTFPSSPMAITQHPLPGLAGVTSSASSYCSGGAGVAIGLDGSANGVNYQLYNSGAPVGTPVAGTGSSISFGSNTLTGTYTVVATNATTGCVRNMTGSATVSVNPLPLAYTVTGSASSYCQGGTGITINLANSETGVNYQLYNGSAMVGAPVPGTGSAISFGTHTTAGTYTVLATNNITSCTKNMLGAAIININPLPVAHTLTSSASSYCAGTSGVTMNLDNSTVGVSYQLYQGLTAVGSPVAGTGSSLSLGTQTASGTYMAVATTNATGCTNNMTGAPVVTINPAPIVYNVTGGGSLCTGGSTGVSIGVAGSNTGISYQLYNGSIAVGSPVAGTGVGFNFPGTYTTAGTYNVVASTSLGCLSSMTGTANVIVNGLPTDFAVTGGGAYCTGGSGMHVLLSSSTPGVMYQLFLGSLPVGTYTGTGLVLDFGLKTAPGTYTVLAYNPTTTCTANMPGSAVITVNAPPSLQEVTGGGSYCSGTTGGVSIGLENSVSGVSYQLYKGSIITGDPVLGSTGSPINFGTYTSVGTYSVLATTIGSSCQSAMVGTASVSISPLPNLQSVTGGGTICQGAAGANVYLNNTQTGVNYQLYNGFAPVGVAVAGTGSSMSLGLQTVQGTYTVQAVNAATGCTRNMNGTATVNVNLLPDLHTVTGGGNYCAGDVGSPVGLGSSQTGINYQVYNGTTPVGGTVTGTGGSLVFGVYTASGTYTVMGINALTGCSRTMTGNAIIGVNAQPAAYLLTGGGSICQGNSTSLILNGSNTGVTYQLYNGSTEVGSSVSGTGGSLVFSGLTDAGAYNVIATNNLTSCSRYMTGLRMITVNTLPASYVVSGGGDYCQDGAGVAVGLMGSGLGVSYRLYNGSMVVGAPVAGNGGVISFGNQTAEGTYTVLATNTGTGCTNAMSGSASVVINPLPTAYTVSGGGTICANQPGLVVSLDNSTPDINYQLKNGSAPVADGLMIGTGAGTMSFIPVAAPGTYMVVATDPSTGCSKNMTGSATVIVNAVPEAKMVTGGGSYCNGVPGVAVGLTTSQNGVSYQLMNGAATVGAPVTGSGGAISFGMQPAGVYTVNATNEQNCSNAMTGSATVNMNAAPASYNVLSSGSSYCSGGEGVHIFLSSSVSGIEYQLYRATTIAMGEKVIGTGGVIDFSAQTMAGTYTVKAHDPVSGCDAVMTGSVSVVINPLPAAYAITGGGGYCSGTTGVNIGLANSTPGVTYQLYTSGGSAVGAPVSGVATGGISFGAHMAGSYYVLATNNATTCTNTMTGTVTATLNTAPEAFNVTGGGAYCTGGTGVEVGLAGSASGISYQLYRNGNPVGSAVISTGGALSFGMQTAAGNYTVAAMNPATSCTGNMTGSVAVSINLAPGTFAVTGGGDFCAGGAGVSVGLAGSASGVNYQLYKGGTPVTGAVLGGTGGLLNFGLQTAGGSYAVMATSTGNGCTNMMTGTAIVNANTLPSVQLMTGGGSYCATAGATGLPVGLNGSQTGMTYQLYKDATPVGTPVAGTGVGIGFGLKTEGGVYTVVAMNTATGCSNNMSGTSAIVVNPAVTPAVSISTVAGSTVCLGVLQTFTATTVNGGISPMYQWKVNGANVGLGTNAYGYVPSNGDVVSVSMTSSEACAAPATVTASVTMTVSEHQIPRAVVSVTPNDSVCAGTTVTYAVTPEFGGTAPTYVWKKNGMAVGTGTSYQYVPANNDVITCEMTSNFPCRLEDVVSTNVKMNVQSPTAPVVSITANPGTTISAGQTVILTASATNAGADPSYKWSVNGAAIQGATNATYISSNFANNDEVTVDVTSNGVCAPMTGTKTVVMKLTTTGVASVSNAQSDIRLIPNPNKGDFIIRGTTGVADGKDMTVDVTDMLGQVVYTGKIKANNGTLNDRIQLTNTLANGMYMLTLRSASETKVFHFVLQQ